jgi:hypothetical protein
MPAFDPTDAVLPDCPINATIPKPRHERSSTSSLEKAQSSGKINV